MKNTGIKKITPPIVGVWDLLAMCEEGPSFLMLCFAFIDLSIGIKKFPTNNEKVIEIVNKMQLLNISNYKSRPKSVVISCSTKKPRIGEISMPFIGGMILLNGSRYGRQIRSRNL